VFGSICLFLVRPALVVGGNVRYLKFERVCFCHVVASNFYVVIAGFESQMTHHPCEIACEIEIDKNFNLDRAICTLSKFLSIEIETAILVAGWLYIQ
jgi:hypothetical protein